MIHKLYNMIEGREAGTGKGHMKMAIGTLLASVGMGLSGCEKTGAAAQMAELDKAEVSSVVTQTTTKTIAECFKLADQVEKRACVIDVRDALKAKNAALDEKLAQNAAESAALDEGLAQDAAEKAASEQEEQVLDSEITALDQGLEQDDSEIVTKTKIRESETARENTEKEGFEQEQIKGRQLDTTYDVLSKIKEAIEEPTR